VWRHLRMTTKTFFISSLTYGDDEWQNWLGHENGEKISTFFLTFCSNFLRTSGVNFTNIFRAAFMRVDSNRTKKYWWLDSIFMLLGSTCAKAVRGYVSEIDTWHPFHQHSTYSFCARRSQKRKRYWGFDWIITLSGSTCIKAACKTLMKLTPGVYFTNNLQAAFCVKVFCTAFPLCTFQLYFFAQEYQRKSCSYNKLLKLIAVLHFFFRHFYFTFDLNYYFVVDISRSKYVQIPFTDQTVDTFDVLFITTELRNIFVSLLKQIVLLFIIFLNKNNKEV